VHIETALSPFGGALCLLFSHHAVGVKICVIAPLVAAARFDKWRAGGYAFSFSLVVQTDTRRVGGGWMMV
jgi:hypothetical protein